MHSRRDFLRWTGIATVANATAPILSFLSESSRATKVRSIRCINVVNFIRGVEPRFATDLMLPVRKQMECILENKLPATWLLQFDALVEGEFSACLKAHMPATHEVGFWFEMNQKLCNAAGVEWRGRPGYEWDHLPPVAFTIGYTPEERIRLADAAMLGFKKVWGKTPKSVASWNLDSLTMAHLADHYGIDAFAVCRDQIATDGFTIWGAPIAGYYPSKTNCWSSAVSRANQIDVPVFRMLGQDPVHYYGVRYRLPDGKTTTEPDTMEPVWAAGRSPRFIKMFLDMISRDPCLEFAYAQLGQENSFPWPDMASAYPAQMKSLGYLRDSGTVHVETMGASGRRFKNAFGSTPPQAQVMLDDWIGGGDSSQGSIWYQSRFYRANLHFKGDVPFFRDLTVYSDHNPQPFLHAATRQNDVEQRMPAVLDGYHWSTSPGSVDEIGAGGFFQIGGKDVRLAGKPVVREEGNALHAELPLQGAKTLLITFEETQIRARLATNGVEFLSLSFRWDPAKAALKSVHQNLASFRWQGCDYSVHVANGRASETTDGWTVTQARNGFELTLAQPNYTAGRFV